MEGGRLSREGDAVTLGVEGVGSMPLEECGVEVVGIHRKLEVVRLRTAEANKPSSGGLRTARCCEEGVN